MDETFNLSLHDIKKKEVEHLEGDIEVITLTDTSGRVFRIAIFKKKD